MEPPRCPRDGGPCVNRPRAGRTDSRTPSRTPGSPDQQSPTFVSPFLKTTARTPLTQHMRATARPTGVNHSRCPSAAPSSDTHTRGRNGECGGIAREIRDFSEKCRAATRGHHERDRCSRSPCHTTRKETGLQDIVFVTGIVTVVSMTMRTEAVCHVISRFRDTENQKPC